MRSFVGLGFGLVLVAVSACTCGSPFIVTDSFEPPATDLFESAPDSLHDYVVGTEVGLDIRAARMFVDMKSVQVVSKNPELLEVLDQSLDEDNVIHAQLHALAAGTAGLDFLDDRQRPLEERVLQIKLPDAIELAVNIDTDKGYTIPVIDGDNLLVAASGSTTFRVTYKAEDAELKGVGVLVGAATTVSVANPTRAGPDREFLTLTATAEIADAAPVELKVADQIIRTLQVRVVDVAEIATIQLDEGDLPAFKNNGDVFSVWAKAFTTDAAPVFGAPFAWTFDSAGIDGGGDIVSYTFEGGGRRRIQVGSGEAVANLTVEAKDGTAVVSSTETPGCSSSSAAPGGPLVLALALGVRRRRATTR